MKKLPLLALFLSLFSGSRPAQAVDPRVYVHTLVTISYDTGWWDYVIYTNDPSSNAQAKCPKMAFIINPSYKTVDTVITDPTSITFRQAPGQPPGFGQSVLQYCQYDVWQLVQPNTSYQQIISPVCTSDGTLPTNLALIWRYDTTGPIHSQQDLYFDAVGPFQAKNYWRQVVGACHYSQNYYFKTQISYFYSGMLQTAAWF